MESLSPELIQSVAAEAGLTIGRFLPTLDTGEVAARIREEIPGVAICAVNKVGARVEINIHEMHNPPVVLPTDPCDVVAAETGRILYMEVYDGQERVKVGETVGKGQQIVTGVTESADGKLRYVHASASVIADAYFSHTFTLHLSQTERVYSGDEEKRYALDLFGTDPPLPAGRGGKRPPLRPAGGCGRRPPSSSKARATASPSRRSPPSSGRRRRRPLPSPSSASGSRSSRSPSPGRATPKKKSSSPKPKRSKPSGRLPGTGRKKTFRTLSSKSGRKPSGWRTGRRAGRGARNPVPRRNGHRPAPQTRGCPARG